MQVSIIPAGDSGAARTLAASTPWQEVLDAYLDAAVDSAETRRAYRRCIADALTAVGVVTLAELDGAELAAWRAAVVASDRHSPSTKAQAVCAVRSFLTWARTMGAAHLSGDVVRAALRVPKATVLRPYSVVTEPEIGALIAATDTPRDRAILAVLLGAGLRVSETVGLDCSDLIDVEGGAALHVRQGKGRKDRMVPIRPEVATAIRAYLAATGRHLGDPGPLFTAHDRAIRARNGQGGRLSARSVGSLVEVLVEKAGGIDAKRVSPHSLRHSYALRALRAGANVAAVSKLLGHANVATTSRYLDHLGLAELRAAVPDIPGLHVA